MHNPKLDALKRQTNVERLFGKDAAVPEPAPEATPPPPPVGEADIVRKSYCILRGRIEMLPNLELRNLRGQTRLLPWHYFGGASMDDPGTLVMIFDGPEGSCQVTINGLGLNVELLPGVKAQRVSWIEELDELAAAAAAKADPAEPVVTGTWIKGGGREWGRGASQSR